MQSNSEIRCVHCGRGIIASNYLIHEARCQIMSSRVGPAPEPSSSKINERSGRSRMQFGGEREMLAEERQMREGSRVQPNQPRLSRPEERVPAPDVKFSYPSHVRPSESNTHSSMPAYLARDRERQRIFRNSEPEQQRIPCTFCGYKQTLLELDTHPNQCEHRSQQCPHCHSNFPRSLMADHAQVCTQSPNYSHIHEENGLIQEDDQEEDGFFENLSRFMGPTRRRSQEPEGENYTVLIESDGRGGFHRRVIYNENPRFNQIRFSQRRPSPFFPQRQQQYSHPFANFFNLLNLIAARNGQQEVGLTKQEIKKLKKIKYRGKGQGQKDLCTICYCEFEEQEKVIELRCKHLYHEECIVKWLEKNATCPVCKQSQTDRQIEREE